MLSSPFFSTAAGSAGLDSSATGDGDGDAITSPGEGEGEAAAISFAGVSPSGVGESFSRAATAVEDGEAVDASDLAAFSVGDGSGEGLLSSAETVATGVGDEETSAGVGEGADVPAPGIVPVFAGSGGGIVIITGANSSLLVSLDGAAGSSLGFSSLAGAIDVGEMVVSGKGVGEAVVPGPGSGDVISTGDAVGVAGGSVTRTWLVAEGVGTGCGTVVEIFSGVASINGEETGVATGKG
jgi:hypothetical protein